MCGDPDLVLKVCSFCLRFGVREISMYRMIGCPGTVTTSDLSREGEGRTAALPCICREV